LWFRIEPAGRLTTTHYVGTSRLSSSARQEANTTFIRVIEWQSTNHWFGLLFDAHFDSNATTLADNPKVENLTTSDGFLIIDW
jgi:hypothetical protein